MPQQFADQFKSIPMSSNLGESLERARGFAREQAHRTVMLEHLLLAFTEDPDAAAVLQASKVDLLRLGTDVSGYLGRLLEDMRAEHGAEPSADPELLRVLQAAGQAAQQSRRRQIDGAIVLAAVVGDGKSPAAGLLKAHGLTFEEAIRALQKANAKANAQERSKQFATPPPAAEPAAPPAPAPESAAPVPATSAAAQQPAGQSVEEILAAARARIQQRSSVTVSKAPAKAPAETAPAEREPLPLSSLTSAPPPAASPAQELDDDLTEEAPPEPAPAPAASAPPQALPGMQVAPQVAPQAGSQGRPSWTPPAASPHPAARLPQPPPPRAVAPFPQRPLQPGDGPARPPLPQRAGGPQAGPGYPNRPARAPWPEPGDPAAPPRPLAPLAANGAAADVVHPPAARPRQRTGGQGGHGPLVETIPRRMRLGASTPAQVRISRDKIDGLIHLLLNGRGMAQRPDGFLTRALTVRLRAPDGGFWIEAASPETQWVETESGLQQDEFASWRWTVTPQRRGRGKLLLLVTARTVGRDGLAAETAPPDRVIEVTVKGGRLRGVMRLGGLLAAVLLGAALGRFGSEFWAMGAAIFKRIAGG